jgi:hypothetical protein
MLQPFGQDTLIQKFQQQARVVEFLSNANSCQRFSVSVRDDGGLLYFDLGSDGELLARILQQPRVLCSTWIDESEVVFEIEPLAHERLDGKDWLHAHLVGPSHALERRRFPRVDLQAQDAVVIGIRSELHRFEETRVLRASVVDISMSGLCFTYPSKAGSIFTPGMSFTSCTLSGGGIGAIELNLYLVRVWDDEQAAANGLRRVACNFFNMASVSLLLLQEFIARKQASGSVPQGFV